MRHSLRICAVLALCLTIVLVPLPRAAAAEADWRTLYLNLLSSQQSQLRARRAAALIDLTGDGTPEMLLLSSVKGESRNSRLSVYTVRSGAVAKMTADAFDFDGVTFAGVRSLSLALRATGALKPCLSISITGVSGGVTTTTRLAFVADGSATKLTTVLHTARAKKKGKAAYTVDGGAVSSAQYNQAFAAFCAAYSKKGSALPYQTFSSSAKTSTLKSGVSRLASRYRSHSTVSRVSLSKTKLSLAYGKSYALKAAVSPSSAIYDTLSWSSDHPEIVKVSGGTLTALNTGSATITVKTSGGVKRSCKVTVTPPAAASVEIRGDAHTVVLRQTLKLSVAVSPAKASQSVKWSSANSSVASVSKSGVVTGKRMGTTTIRAKTANGKTASFTVTVLAEALNKGGAIIDISRWNNVSSWKNLQKSVAFVILRCGVTYSASHSKAGEMDIDARFKEYAAKCLSYGIPFGVYYYGMASTPEIARREAEKAYSVAKAYNPLFYVYDAEEDVLTGASIEAFAARLRELGVRKVGCYIANNLYKRYGVDTSKFDFIWIPHYGTNTGQVESTPDYRCDLHQYSSRGSVPGVGGDVDVNRLMGTKPLSYFIS
jgi:uncharacterized protein YjdB